MSIHVCKCEHKGRTEYHLRYPGMTEDEAQNLADKINAGALAAPASAGVEEFPLPALATAVVNAARDALNDSIDALDTINIPSHLAAALSLRLDEYDTSLGLQARTERKV